MKTVQAMDEFEIQKRADKVRSLCGVLSQYANPELAEQEEGAWERAVVEKHLRNLAEAMEGEKGDGQSNKGFNGKPDL